MYVDNDNEGVVFFFLVEHYLNDISTACAKDGMMKLWDCATQSCITNLYKGVLLNDCHVDEDAILAPTKQTPAQDERDYGTEAKVALAADENGTLVAVDLRSRQLVGSTQAFLILSNFHISVF